MARMQKIAKRRNSLAAKIPVTAAKTAGLKEGDAAEVDAEGAPVALRRPGGRYRIEDLVKEMKPENEPEYVDWGPPVGKEIW